MQDGRGLCKRSNSFGYPFKRAVTRYREGVSLAVLALLSTLGSIAHADGHVPFYLRFAENQCPPWMDEALPRQEYLTDARSAFDPPFRRRGDPPFRLDDIAVFIVGARVMRSPSGICGGSMAGMPPSRRRIRDAGPLRLELLDAIRALHGAPVRIVPKILRARSSAAGARRVRRNGNRAGARLGTRIGVAGGAPAVVRAH